jgi:hypothetical protein
VTVVASSTTPADVWVTNGRKQRMIPDEATGELRPYQRTSAFAAVLDDKSGLIPWKAWCALKGAAELPSIAEQARHSPKTPAGLIDQLADAGGARDAASKGSARHEILAMALTGARLPDTMGADALTELNRVLKLIEGLGTVVAVEAATVNDEYQVAGSCDLILRDPQGQTIVGEFKTGRTINILGASVQLIAHARARYWVDGARGEWVSPFRPRLVVIHAPQSSEPPTLVELDPDHAKGWADLAVRVRAARKDAGRR